MASPTGAIPQNEEELKTALGEEGKIPDAPVTPTEPEEYEIRLDTGEVFKGKDKDEVLQKLAKAKADATAAIRDRERQIRELKELKSQPKAEVGSEFNKDEYYNLFAQDPMAAFDYAMSYKLGVPPEDVGPALRYAYTTTQVVNAQMENAAFRMKYPDAPLGDEFANIMVERMNELGRDWTAQNLGATYLELVHEGKIKPEKKSKESDNTPPAVIPSLGSTSSRSAEDDEMSKVEGMSTAELEKYLRAKGML